MPNESALATAISTEECGIICDIVAESVFLKRHGDAGGRTPKSNVCKAAVPHVLTSPGMPENDPAPPARACSQAGRLGSSAWEDPGRCGAMNLRPGAVGSPGRRMARGGEEAR